MSQAKYSITARQLLDEVNNAILGLIQGTAEEYWIGNRKVRKNDLDKLRLMRKELQAEVANDEGSNMAVNLVQFGV